MYYPHLYIGTSGFTYGHWENGAFYPENFKGDRLAWYASRMNSVEINASFYRIPKPITVERWSDRVPDKFRIVLKAPKSVTHTRKLVMKDDSGGAQGEGLLEYFIDSYKEIEEHKRGPVLVQIPPSFRIDLGRLEDTLEVFYYDQVQVAFEVRHPSWIVPEVFDLLRTYNAAMVTSDWPGCETPLEDTADFIYVRRHGTEGTYAGSYSEESLKKDLWSIEKYLKKKRDVYVFFNNDDRAYAPKNAMLMNQLALNLFD